MLVSAPFDDWWHNAYGLDVKIISPPHMILAAGFFGIELGTVMLLLAFMNRADEEARLALQRLFLYGGGWIFYKLRHREGLGLGDVKLIAMVGSFLGLRGALFTLIVGSVSGSVIGYGYIKVTGRDAGEYQLPFGTFLGLGALAAALGVEKMLGWTAGM